MADRVRKVRYCYATTSARAGQGAAVLGAVRQAGIDLLSFTGFPTGGGRAQIDLVAEDMAGVRRVLQREGWRLSSTKKALLVQGADRVGACHAHLAKLAERGIRVTAASALSAGKGRWAMIVWVKARDYARAARALGAR